GAGGGVSKTRRHLTSGIAAAAAERETEKERSTKPQLPPSRQQQQQQHVTSSSTSTTTTTTSTTTTTTTTTTSTPPAAPPLRFDADTAVRVLRGAGYAEHALWVADAAGQIDAVLDILLDELGDGEEAIAFLETLPRRRRAEALQRYGRSLIALLPEQATRLIMDLCCSPPPDTSSPSQAPSPSASQAPSSWFTASVSQFAHLYSGQPTALMLLCEFILNTNSGCTATPMSCLSSCRFQHLFFLLILVSRPCTSAVVVPHTAGAVSG
ncbi:hypothetical protein Agub_g10690, partial [Astrephomene gubernaculifera]